MVNVPGDDEPPTQPHQSGSSQPPGGEQGSWQQQSQSGQQPAPSWGQPAQPGGYGPPPPAYGPPQGYPPMGYAPPEHPKATTVLVLGILGIVVCGFIAPFAWRMGKRTVAEIDAAGGQLGGRGQAQAGYILGLIGTLLLVLAVVFVIILVVIGVLGAVTSSTTSGTSFG